MDSRTVLRYSIGQTFLATFRSDLDLLQAYNNLDTDQNVRTAFFGQYYFNLSVQEETDTGSQLLSQIYSCPGNERNENCQYLGI